MSTQSQNGRSKASSVLRASGAVVNWIWDKIIVLFVLAIIGFVVYACTVWTDQSATDTMKSELQDRAFTDISVIDAPTMAQTHVYNIVGFGSNGTYSATAGNCRFTIQTPDGVPVVKTKDTGTSRSDVAVYDADMTKLRMDDATKDCF